ncbi:hypothetical protein QTP88_020380 [Uroleucon formosanum]
MAPGTALLMFWVETNRKFLPLPPTTPTLEAAAEPDQQPLSSGGSDCVTRSIRSRPPKNPTSVLATYLAKKLKTIPQIILPKHGCNSNFLSTFFNSVVRSSKINAQNHYQNSYLCTAFSTYLSVYLVTANMRFTIIGFLVLVMGAAVKAHIHFIRLALLAAMGLAGMWMMHKLAQDWHKISSSRPAKPAAMAGKLLGLWKRSLPDEVSANKGFD